MRETMQKMGHALLRRRNTMKQRYGGGSHDPDLRISPASPVHRAEASALRQAASTPTGTRAAPLGASSRTTCHASHGTGPRRLGLACHHCRGGTVALAGPAATTGQDFRPAASPRRLAAAATAGFAAYAARTRPCPAVSWGPCAPAAVDEAPAVPRRGTAG